MTSGVLPWDGGSRFSRFSFISWWDQERLRKARILVVGAGALGNELVKNLALLGVGTVTVVDMDRVETSNLSRSILFREGDLGRAKAEVVCAAARDVHPALDAQPLVENVLYGVGLGHVRDADLVLGGLDNREARLFLSRACNLVGRPWIDGALDVLAGLVRVFVPDGGACYECTLSEADWAILDQRRACSLLPRDTAEPVVPTTPTTASVIAGLQCGEAVKLLHGLPGLRNEGYQFDGLGFDSYRVGYRRDPDCYGHDRFEEVAELEDVSSASTLGELLDEVRRAFGPEATVASVRELVRRLDCPGCGAGRPWRGALDALDPELARCPQCSATCVPEAYHRLDAADAALDLGSLGIPPWDILRVQVGDKLFGAELTLDRKRRPA